MPFDVHLPLAAAILTEVRYLTDAQSDEGLGPGGLPPGPPMSPGMEARMTTDPTGVVAHCLMVQQPLAKRGLKIVHQLISRNAAYGVVWRADLAGPDGDAAEMRFVCWKIPGSVNYSFLAQPLQMFDPSQSIPPLTP